MVGESLVGKQYTIAIQSLNVLFTITQSSVAYWCPSTGFQVCCEFL